MLIWYCMISKGRVWFGTPWFMLLWYGMVWFCLIWSGKTKYVSYVVIRNANYCPATKFYEKKFILPPIPELPPSPVEEPAGEPGQGEESCPGRWRVRDRGRE